MPITFDQIDRAVDYLRDNATDAAQARANRLYLEQYLKTVRAQEMKKHTDLPVAAQEREALCAPAYLAALQAYRDAIEVDETHRFLREAASAKIEAYRTAEATRRAEGKAYT